MRKNSIPQLLGALVLLASSATAYAAGNHAHDHKPLHGGVVAESNDMDYELVAQPDTITLHVRDHGKPVSVQGASARLTLLQGAEKSEVVLAPNNEGVLQSKGSFKVAAGTKVVALVTLPGKKAANVRFVIK
ncbi:hypothetical protein [Acidovorax sp.]|uniref:hypothetical protein n=1 Tax=Acidovorax sp. TaxID=1872122 RepID=UPI002607C725|nr:hypothetical protein [Acidovorax sp.]